MEHVTGPHGVPHHTQQQFSVLPLIPPSAPSRNRAVLPRLELSSAGTSTTGLHRYEWWPPAWARAHSLSKGYLTVTAAIPATLCQSDCEFFQGRYNVLLYDPAPTQCCHTYSHTHTHIHTCTHVIRTPVMLIFPRSYLRGGSLDT